ncbi:MAG: hypothetical protein AB1393_04995 [Candidatus Edwardsbacteria bacterium]
MDPVLGIIITIVGTVASVSGVAIFVFNGTRSLIREINETTKQQSATLNKITEYMKEMDKRHTEILDKHTDILNKQTETLNKQTETLNKQTEMLNKLSELILEESRANKELIERIDRKISERPSYAVREK